MGGYMKSYKRADVVGPFLEKKKKKTDSWAQAQISHSLVTGCPPLCLSLFDI